MKKLIDKFFGNKENAHTVLGKMCLGRKPRSLQFEPLEERTLLSVSIENMANELAANQQAAVSTANGISDQSSTGSGTIWVKKLDDDRGESRYINNHTNVNELEWARVHGYETSGIIAIDIGIDFDIEFGVEGKWNPGKERRYTYFIPDFEIGYDGKPNVSLSWDIGELIEYGILGRDKPDGIFSGSGNGGGSGGGSGIGTLTQYESAVMINSYLGVIHRADIAGYGEWGGSDNIVGLLKNHGKIDLVFVEANGQLENYVEGGDRDVIAYIETVVVNDRGDLTNAGDNAKIDTAIVNSGGYLQNNGPNGTSPQITLLTVNGGTVVNTGDALIETAFLNNGGTISNRGKIDNLTYISGMYTGTGTIDTLTVINDSAGINWGNVNNVQFGSNGSGSITVNASGFNMQNVNLTNGNIVLNLTGQNLAGKDLGVYFLDTYGNGNEFNMTNLLAGLFGENATINGLNFLNSFTVTHGDKSLAILIDGTYNNGWAFNSETDFVSWDGQSIITNGRSVVTTLDDSINPNDGLISLREAIAYAGTIGVGTTITFAPSLYGKTIELTRGELSIIDKNITIDASGMNIAIDAAQKSRVFNIAQGANVTLTGLIIMNGSVGIYNSSNMLTVTNCLIIGNSVGIQNTSVLTVTITNSIITGNTAGGVVNTGMLTITNSTISGNSTSASGGGIANTGTLTVTNSTISGNSASASGGGISNGGNPGRLTVTNCTISGNSTDNGGGGIANNSTLTITNSTISGNLATFGGGILNNSMLTITSSTISGNTTSSDGGGIYNLYGTLVVTSSTLSGNRAGKNGGGIWNRSSSARVEVSRSTIERNSASDWGGGIYNVSNNDFSSVMRVTNCLISNNSAFSGGGICNGLYGVTFPGAGSGGALTITNCTISGNGASYGAGIYNDTSGTNHHLWLYNTIVAQNSGYGNDLYINYPALYILAKVDPRVIVYNNLLGSVSGPFSTSSKSVWLSEFHWELSPGIKLTSN